MVEWIRADVVLLAQRILLLIPCNKTVLAQMVADVLTV